MKTLLLLLGLVGLVGAHMIDGATCAVLLVALLLVRLGPFRFLRLVAGLLLMVRGLG